MRDALLGKSHGSVPSVRPGATSGSSPWGNTASQGYAPQPGAAAPPLGSAGGSFLGTAAASAAGVVGGALLMNSFRGMFGGHHTGQSAFDPGSASRGAPWGSDASGSELARDAGLNDIGRGERSASYDDNSQRAGLFGSSGGNDDNDYDGDEVDVGGDFGGGDSDSA
jgi:hypothetical protein